ncbi:MAG: hypothetical protein ACPGWR_18115 [Ardenticatenaceae bacterium]
MIKSNIPFGMLFETPAMTPLQELPIPKYDPTESISFITDARGQKVPYVQETWAIFGTQTITRVEAETTDADFNNTVHHMGTTTVTKIAVETTDTDFSNAIHQMGTQTITQVIRETTDSDPYYL